jgi:hypothetical protein
MSVKLSTGLRNFMLDEGSFRKAFEDSLIKIYSGTAPAEADDIATGTLLVTFTKASGAVVALERSTPEIYSITIGDHASAATFIVNITIDGVGPTSYTFTNTPDAGDVNAVAVKVAQMLDDVKGIQAVATGVGGVLWVFSDIAGVPFTCANGGGTGAVTVGGNMAEATLNTLKFLYGVAGIISKNTDVWSGVAGNTGTAGYFRLVTNLDTNADSTTEIRLQGSVSTSGSELNMSSINITSGATQTIDTFTIELPYTAS